MSVTIQLRQRRRRLVSNAHRSYPIWLTQRSKDAGKGGCWCECYALLPDVCRIRITEPWNIMPHHPLPPSFTTADAVAFGVSKSTLYRMRERGEVVEISRGTWRRANAAPTPHEALIAVTLRAPHATVCLLSALAFHELTDVIPMTVDVAVARGRHRPVIDHPPVHVHVFDADTFPLGREHVAVSDHEYVPIYNPVRTVVDALRLRNQIGTDLAYGAVRRLVARRRAAAGDLVSLAGELRCTGPVTEALEVLQA